MGKEKLLVEDSFLIGGNDMDIEMFIKKCFEIGILLLNKEKLTEEEKEFLNALDSFEKWIQDVKRQIRDRSGAGYQG